METKDIFGFENACKIIGEENKRLYGVNPYEEITKENYADKITAEKELFEAVYQWGHVGIVTDFTCPTFQSLLANVRKYN